MVGGGEESTTWAAFEALAAKAVAARAEEWGLPSQGGAPVRCVFLGPEGVTGVEVAAGDADAAPRSSVGPLEKVRFRWSISVPDAPPRFSQEEVVVARAAHVLERGIPVPAGWRTVLKFRARVLEAVEAAGRGSRDHDCIVQGVFRDPALARPLDPLLPPAPRTGGTWIIREAGEPHVEVWLAGHHAANKWWCVKAPSGPAWASDVVS